MNGGQNTLGAGGGGGFGGFGGGGDSESIYSHQSHGNRLGIYSMYIVLYTTLFLFISASR